MVSKIATPTEPYHHRQPYNAFHRCIYTYRCSYTKHTTGLMLAAAPSEIVTLAVPNSLRIIHCFTFLEQKEARLEEGCRSRRRHSDYISDVIH